MATRLTLSLRPSTRQTRPTRLKKTVSKEPWELKCGTPKPVVTSWSGCGQSSPGWQRKASPLLVTSTIWPRRGFCPTFVANRTGQRYRKRCSALFSLIFPTLDTARFPFPQSGCKKVDSIPVKDRQEEQAAPGFEPGNNGFANRRLKPLGYAARAKTVVNLHLFDLFCNRISRFKHPTHRFFEVFQIRNRLYSE